MSVQKRKRVVKQESNAEWSRRYRSHGAKYRHDRAKERLWEWTLRLDCKEALSTRKWGWSKQSYQLTSDNHGLPSYKEDLPEGWAVPHRCIPPTFGRPLILLSRGSYVVNGWGGRMSEMGRSAITSSELPRGKFAQPGLDRSSRLSRPPVRITFRGGPTS